MVNFINKIFCEHKAIDNAYTTKFDINISVIRLISLMMIICCHILQYLGYEAAFWVNLGVQIFFFISGFLYGKKNIEDVTQFYKDKLKKILLPYLLLLVIVIFMEKIYISNSYNKTFLLGNLLGFQGFNGTLKTLSHTWFVSYILICYLITPLLQKIFSNTKNVTKALVLLIVFIQLTSYFRVTNIKAPWLINYILGYVFSAHYKNDKKREKIFSCFIISTAIITLPFRIILQYDLEYIQFPGIILKNTNLIIEYSHVLLGCSLFIILYKILEKFRLKKYNIILRLSDKYSYFIYLVHQIFILKQFSLMNLTTNLSINIIIAVSSSLVSGIILYYIYRLVLIIYKKTVNAFSEKMLYRVK